MSIHRKKALTADSVTGFRRIHQFDHIDGNHVVSAHQDVEPILENNKAWRNADRSSPHKDGMRRVASIPLVVIEKWMREDGINVYKPEHWDRVKEKLNDPEWAYLRTDNSVI